jgi:hypothetical protein
LIAQAIGDAMFRDMFLTRWLALDSAATATSDAGSAPVRMRETADQFDFYAFGGGTMDVGGGGGPFSIDKRVGSTTPGQCITVTASGTVQLGSGDGDGCATVVVRKPFNALEGGIYEVDDALKVQFEGTATGSHYIAFNETIGSDDAILRIGREAADKANICWYDGAASAAEDGCFYRNAAGDLLLEGMDLSIASGDMLHLTPQASAPATCNAAAEGSIYYDSDNDEPCCCGNPDGLGALVWYECASGALETACT